MTARTYERVIVRGVITNLSPPVATVVVTFQSIERAVVENLKADTRDASLRLVLLIAQCCQQAQRYAR